MPGPQGLISFPGVLQTREVSFVLSHGHQPSVAVFEIVPQSSMVPTVGDLVLTYDTTTITFPQCKINTSLMRFSSEGYLYHFAVMDRRWKWSYGEVTGAFNLRKPDGRVDTITEKTPQDLCQILLGNMGITGTIDVSAVPDGSRPQVYWYASNPAEELAKLCVLLGCRIVYNPPDNVTIARAGVGTALPTTDAMNAAFTWTKEVRPDTLKIITAPVLFQAKFELEAVGLDVDGRVKLIKDLSYNPGGKGNVDGWNDAVPKEFEATEVTTSEERLKNATVFKWYRIKEEAASGILNVPGYTGYDIGNPTASTPLLGLWQLLPIQEELVQTYFDRNAISSSVGSADDKGVVRPQAAYLEGVWYSEAHSSANQPAFTLLDVDFTIDAEKGIVKLAEPVYRYEAATTQQAILYLTCVVQVTEQASRVPWTYFYARTKAPPLYGTGARILRHPELQSYYVAQYDASNALIGVLDNFATIDAQATLILDAIEQEYAAVSTADVEYAGLVDLALDGARQQITWKTGRQLATTRVTLNSEHDPFVPAYDEREKRIVNAKGFGPHKAPKAFRQVEERRSAR